MTFKTNFNGSKAVITTDGGAGSSGKGSLNSWLADNYKFEYSTNNWMPNAGHYTELDDGRRILVQHIPSSFVNPNIILYINAGAAINIDILINEIKMLEENGFEINSRLYIHPHANVITQEDVELEKSTIKSGSTFKGCGAALAGKTMRHNRKLAKDYDELSPYIKDMTMQLNEDIVKGASVIIEGSQGIDLDINHAEFPYCTSRQTNLSQLAADAGIAPNLITNTILNLRTNPIRISNVSAADGKEAYSGNYWDAKEITWEEVATNAGWDDPNEFLEKYGYAMLTSVTKKVRRIFEFPKERMKYVHSMSGGLPNDNFLLYSLNFINFVDKEVEGVTNINKLMTEKVTNWLKNNIYCLDNVNLKWVRTGPRHSQIVKLPDDFDINHY